jgi:hypothetical protein
MIKSIDGESVYLGNAEHRNGKIKYMYEEIDLIKDVASRLEKAGLPYMMTGSMAMAIYATPRMTRDIDMVIQVYSEDIGTLVNLFRDDFYIDETSVRQAIQSRGMFNIIHNE